tara:strand:+ start:146 stop:388 length:243 start_codon:yes stop_codon:yes gene_type:complete
MGERNYKKEAKWHATSKQKKRRAQTNAARKKVGLKVGDPREVDHYKSFKNGGGNGLKNLRIVSRSTNRKKGASTKRKRHA